MKMGFLWNFECNHEDEMNNLFSGVPIVWILGTTVFVISTRIFLTRLERRVDRIENEFWKLPITKEKIK